MYFKTEKQVELSRKERETLLKCFEVANERLDEKYVKN